jgi:AhpD family alkylhydroperoxidase
MSTQTLIQEKTPAGFTIYTIENAPEASRDNLKSAQKMFGGALPNLLAVLAGSPPLLAANMATMQQLAHISLSQIEQQIVELAVSNQNKCEYCVVAHTFLSRTLPQDPIQAAGSGHVIADPQLESLRTLAIEMVKTSGKPDAATKANFHKYYNFEQALEVILLLTVKSLQNYTNNLAETPIDALFGKSHSAAR